MSTARPLLRTPAAQVGHTRDVQHRREQRTGRSSEHRGLDRRWAVPPQRAGSDGETYRLLALGELRVVLLDVVAPPSVRDTFTLRLAALRLVLPPAVRAAGAVVCLDTAVWLFAGGPPPPRVDVAVPTSSRPRAAGLRVHELAYAAGDLWAPLPDEPVTSPARTAADVACRRTPTEAVPVLAALGLTTGLRPGQVHGVLARLDGRSGVRRARRAVRAWADLVPPTLAVGAARASVDAVAGHPVGVEDTLDLADGADHVVEVTRGRHLEGEARDGDAVA